MRVYLTGFMGAGKSTVGRELAARLSWPFVDLDEEVELAAGLAVREVFEQRGEPEFRRLERGALLATLDRDPAVVAVGGGTLTVADNLETARAGGLVIWINPPFAAIVARIGAAGKADRPLFRDETSAFSLYRERLASYRRADLVIDVGAEESPAEVVGRIVLRLGERACST